MFHWIFSALLLFSWSAHAKTVSTAGGNTAAKATKPAKAEATKPKTVQTNVVRDCKSIAIGPCMKVDGIGRSYMGLFTGLAIEPHGSSEHYSVFEVSVEAVAPRERCDLNMNCVGTFNICPIKGRRIHNRANVCLQSMSHISHTPTEVGAIQFYQ